MKNVNLNNKLELTRSTLFDEVTWGTATSGYITSYGNNKPKGWIAIEKEALAFMKVNSLHNVSVLLDNTGTSTQVNDDEHKYRNLNEDSDDTENVDEESYNEVWGVMKGEESSTSEEMEDLVPCHLWGITQGDELSTSKEMEDLAPHDQVWGITQGNETLSESEEGQMMTTQSRSECKCFLFLHNILY